MRVAFVHLGREHLGLEYLSAVLRAAGHSTVAAFDAGLFSPVDNVFVNEFLERLLNERAHVLGVLEREEPDLVAFSAYTSTIAWCCSIACEVKSRRPAVPTVFGGIHPTALPAETLDRDGVDFVVAGEGERALCDLVEQIASGGDGTGIPGVWSKATGKEPPDRFGELVADLDTLPRPDKDLFAAEGDLAADYLVAASRGCPCRCAFCCEHVLSGHYGAGHFRRRSVDSVIDELAWARARYGCAHVRFVDPILTTDADWLRELLAKYRARIRVPFRCTSHLAYLDEATVQGLVEAGCDAVEIGVQTFNETLRRRLGCGALGRDAILRVLSLCDRAGLRYEIDLLLGVPGETVADHEAAATLLAGREALTRLKPHNLVFFPGTDLFREVTAGDGFPPEAAEAVRRGAAAHGFFHGEPPHVPPALRRALPAFRALYRILPLLPAFAVRWLARSRLRAVLAYLPRPAVVFLQVLAAARVGDRRILVVLREWMARLRAHFRKGHAPREPKGRAGR